jgi:hypothetical protein
MFYRYINYMSFVPEEISLIVSSDPDAGAVNVSSDGSQFEIQLDGGGIQIPKDAINVNVSVEEATVWWVTPNIIEGQNDTLFIYGDNDATPAVPQLFTVVIPQGLYDLPGLNQAVQAELEGLGARTLSPTGEPLSLISLTSDDATQKVRIRFNYPNVYVDFQPNRTPREILGYRAEQYGPYPAAPLEILAPDIAKFNQVNYFLISTDLVNKGIRFNNSYNQTVAQVLIDVAPGSQIVSRPFNPAKCNAQELAGTKRTNLRFWLTDDKQRPVNTNGEYFTARIVIHYMRPMVIGREK